MYLSRVYCASTVSLYFGYRWLPSSPPSVSSNMNTRLTCHSVFSHLGLALGSCVGKKPSACAAPSQPEGLTPTLPFNHPQVPRGRALPQLFGTSGSLSIIFVLWENSALFSSEPGAPRELPEAAREQPCKPACIHTSCSAANGETRSPIVSGKRHQDSFKCFISLARFLDRKPLSLDF